MTCTVVILVPRIVTTLNKIIRSSRATLFNSGRETNTFSINASRDISGPCWMTSGNTSNPTDIRTKTRTDGGRYPINRLLCIYMILFRPTVLNLNGLRERVVPNECLTTVYTPSKFYWEWTNRINWFWIFISQWMDRMLCGSSHYVGHFRTYSRLNGIDFRVQ